MENTDVRVLVINDKNQVLLILERGGPVSFPSGEGFIKREAWGMPGGRSESSDKDEIAVAKREVEEETGIWPDVNSRIMFEERQKTHTKVAFIGYPAAGKIKINLEEILKCEWFPTRVIYDETFNMYVIQRRMAKELLARLRK